ncbi:bifunctional nuclease family protein [Thermogladius sp. 4427co]|uniref:bifunctional nuclease family protein n=1 Tax=Thermogladius sp. 4427co TaxID=3450718 RepID=UPI003F79A4A2
MKEYLLVKNVLGEVEETVIEGLNVVFPVPRIVCELEDGRKFYLERVPYDIILFINKINGRDVEDDRERFGDILMSMPEVLENLGKHIKRVTIEEFDEKRGVYSAYLEFNDGNITIRRKMVPSHAIFLALLVGKPIYVKKELVDEQQNYYEY